MLIVGVLVMVIMFSVESGLARDNKLYITISSEQQIISQQIAVNAQLLHLETKTHYNDLRTGDFLVGDAGWIADYNDAQNFLYLLQTSSGTMNYGRYSSDAFDALTDQAATTLDLVARASLMKQAEQIMLDDQPLIPTFFAVSSNLVHTNVKGWEPNVTNRHATRYMYFDKTS